MRRELLLFLKVSFYNNHFYEDESLHLVNLYSATTIGSAKKFLGNLKDMVDLQFEAR